MSFISRFIGEYGTVMLYAVITAVAGAAAAMLKKTAARHTKGRTTKRTVCSCIEYVKALYADMPAEEQKEETVKAVMDALAVKGIYISDIEARMRIARQMKENGEKTATAAEKEEKKDGEERENSLWYF